ECAEVRACGRADAVAKERDELLEQLALAAAHEREPVMRESLAALTVQVLERIAKVAWNGGLGRALPVPLIQTERRELPLQNRACVQEHARRAHRAVNHLRGVGIEVEIVGPTLGHGDDQGVA